MPTHRTRELGYTVLVTIIKEKNIGGPTSADMKVSEQWYCSFKG